MIDIFPSVCNNIVNCEGVKHLCTKIQNIEYIDLAEGAIKVR